jgi:hypothetical protein
MGANMRNGKVLLALVLLGLPALGQEGRGAETLPVKPPAKTWAGPTPALEEEKVKPAPKLHEFLGKWSGQWDGFWNVQFTISRIEGDDEKVNVIYEWEERKGQPQNRRDLIGKIEGNVLAATGNRRLIDISLHAADPNSAQAYGHFKNPRRANLTREKAGE